MSPPMPHNGNTNTPGKVNATGATKTTSSSSSHPNVLLRKKSSTLSSAGFDIHNDSSPLEEFFVGLFFLVLFVFTAIILLGDTLLLSYKDPLQWCHAAQQSWPTYKNINAIRDPCYYERTVYLLGWSCWECDFGRRMLMAVILGAAIGYERKVADRPAGIRTMALVSLGAATFTMAGQFAFRSSAMGWDAARVSAAVPSGVGFLGSALIWKETLSGEGGDRQNQKNHVHGITTAASVWLSASVGIGAGGALYVMSVWAVVLVVFVLRLGPHLLMVDDEEPQQQTYTTGADDDGWKNGSVGEGNTTAREGATDWENVNSGNDDSKHYQQDDNNIPTPLSSAEHYEKLKTEASNNKSRFAQSARDRESIRIQKKQLPALHSD